MRKVLLCLSLIVVALFLFGCVKTAESDEALAGEAITISGASFVVKNNLILLAATCQCSGGEFLEYMGADRVTKTEPKIKFKQWSSGETLEYALSSEGRAAIKLCGIQFDVSMVRPTVDDSALNVDFNGDGVMDTPNSKTLKYYR